MHCLDEEYNPNEEGLMCEVFWTISAKIEALYFTVGGQFENYYSKSGAAYVDVKTNTIRTAFRSDEYDDRIKKMMEVLEKWKKKR